MAIWLQNELLVKDRSKESKEEKTEKIGTGIGMNRNRKELEPDELELEGTGKIGTEPNRTGYFLLGRNVLDIPPP